MLWYHLIALSSPFLLSLSLSVTQTNRDVASHPINPQREDRESYKRHTYDHTYSWRNALSSPHAGLCCFNTCGSCTPSLWLLVLCLDDAAFVHKVCVCVQELNPAFSGLVLKCSNTHIYAPNKCDWLIAILKLGVSCCFGVRGERSKVQYLLHFSLCLCG